MMIAPVEPLSRLDSPRTQRCSARMADDQEIVLFLKTFACDKDYNHDFAGCFNHHNNDKERRRCLLAQSYSAKMCPEMKNTGHCPRGDACSMAHNTFEYWVHPQRFRTKMCKEGAKCARPFCFFAHSEAELRQPSEPPRVMASFAKQLAACSINDSSCGGGSQQGCAAAWQPPLSPSTPRQEPLLVIPQHMLQLPQVVQQQQQQQQQAGSLSTGLLPAMNIAECLNINNIGGTRSSSSSASPRSCAGNSNSSNVLPVLYELPAAAPYQSSQQQQQQPDSNAFAAFYGPSAAAAAAAAQSDLPAGAFCQQQQQQLHGALNGTLATMDPSVLAALLQQLNMDNDAAAPAGNIGLAGSVPAAHQPPPPPRCTTAAAAGTLYQLPQQLLFADPGPSFAAPTSVAAAATAAVPGAGVFTGDVLQLAGPSASLGAAAAALPSCQAASAGLGFTSVPATVGMVPPGLTGAGGGLVNFGVQW